LKSRIRLEIDCELQPEEKFSFPFTEVLMKHNLQGVIETKPTYITKWKDEVQTFDELVNVKFEINWQDKLTEKQCRYLSVFFDQLAAELKQNQNE